MSVERDITAMNFQQLSVHFDPRLYGLLITPSKKTAIDNWIAGHPFHISFEDASTAKSVTGGVYMAWIDWIKSDAHLYMRKLNRLEHRYRVAGLKYHRCPYPLRHPTFPPNDDTNTEKDILFRLSQTLETNRPRIHEPFFQIWKEVEKAATEIIKEIDSNIVLPNNTVFLHAMSDRLDLELNRLGRELRNLEVGMLWLEQSVETLSGKSGLHTGELLAGKHTCEGVVFRWWIQNFPEVESGLVKDEDMESFVRHLLALG
ncbi:hypothetical protein ACN47E_008670 [Coniothyrium glycines]